MVRIIRVVSMMCIVHTTRMACTLQKGRKFSFCGVWVGFRLCITCGKIVDKLIISVDNMCIKSIQMFVFLHFEGIFARFWLKTVELNVTLSN